MATIILSDRSVVAITGPDAIKLLQGLVTNTVPQPGDPKAVSAALLTPQGKVLFDMLLVAVDDGVLADCRADQADALIRRLGFYRMRAKVEIALEPDLAVGWSPDGEEPDPGGTVFRDPRLAGLGRRSLCRARPGDDPAPYHAVRVAAGVAEAGADYEPETVFPHEANLDLLAGIAFDKGCFIGQEVVSRMHHRGTARKRFRPCRVAGAMPGRGTPVEAEGRTIGTVGSSAGDVALALLRLDRLAEAQAAGAELSAGAARLTAYRPDWAVDPVPTGTVAAR